MVIEGSREYKAAQELEIRHSGTEHKGFISCHVPFQSFAGLHTNHSTMGRYRTNNNART